MLNVGNASIQNLTALVESMLEKQYVRDRRLMTLMEKVVETQTSLQKNMKLLVARTTGVAVVEEVVLPEGLKFPFDNWEEFEEREHHLSSPQIQSQVVS